MTLEKVIDNVMEMTGQDAVTTIDQMVKDRNKELKTIRKELLQLGIIRRQYERRVAV